MPPPAARLDAFFPAVLGRRQRLIAGLAGIGLGFGVPFVLSVVLVATSGDPSLLILPLPFLGALWLAQGFAPGGYTLEAAGVRIERRWHRRLIPYDQIERVDRRSPRPVGGLGSVGWNSLFGAHGVRWNPWIGWHYLAITNTSALVALSTRRGLVVLSPERPDEFVAALEGALARRAAARGAPRR